MARIFLSYSRSDQQIVRKLVEDLEITGNDIWFDQTLTGGQPWWDNILKNIRDCEIYVLALSPDSLNSEACKHEWTYAALLGKTILPIRLSTQVNVNLLPRQLSKIQVTDYLTQDRDDLLGLSKTIKGLPSSSPLPDVLPEAPPVPISYLGTLKEEIETNEVLNLDEQIALVFKLKASLSEGRASNEVRELLLRLKQRDDLLAKVGKEIDTVLDTIASLGSTSKQDSPRSDRGHEKGPAASKSGGTTAATPAAPCDRCGAANRSGAKFCSTCGSPLSVPFAQTVAEPAVEAHPDRKDVKVRRFVCAPENHDGLISDVKGWLEAQDYNCQQIATGDGGILLQVAQKGSWRKFVGMATSLNIHFFQVESTLTVEIGTGKWVDKAAVGTVSLFVLWPLAVTAGIGAWQQMKLPEKIFDYLGNKLVCK